MEPHDQEVEQKLEDLAQAAGSPRSLALITESLKDREWRVRKAAVEAGHAFPDLSALIPELITAIADPDNVGRRNAAAELLAGIGDRAVPVLILKLEDPDPDVRIFAANVLGEIRSPAAIPALIGRLKDTDENVRLVAVERLGLFDDASVDSVLTGLLDTGDIPLKFSALEALAAHDARIPLTALQTLASQLVLRPGVFRALRSGRQPEAVEIVASGILDRARSSREAATLALSELVRNHPNLVPRISAFLAQKATPDTVIRIAQTLESGDITLRRASVDVLGFIPIPASLSQLVSMAEDDELSDLTAVALARLAAHLSDQLIETWDQANEREKSLLARAFGTANITGAVSRLIDALDSSDGHLIGGAARALGQLSTVQAIPDIAVLLAHPYPDVRAAAAYALQCLASQDPETVSRHVLPHTAADVPFTRAAATTALAAVATPDSRTALYRLLKDPDPEVRATAVTSLNPNALDGAFEAVAPLLADESPEVRRVVVEIIGKIVHPRVVEVLKSALEDSDLWVRIGSVRSLGNRTEKESADPLVVLLRRGDNPPPLVSAALKALERKNPVLLVETTLPLLASTDVDVVLPALEALAGVPMASGTGTPLARLMEHEHWDIRSKAAQVYALHLGEQARPLLMDRLRAESDALVHRALRFALDQIAQKRT